jgi:hypothetical protein
MAHIANSTSSTSSPCSGWHGNLLPQPPLSGARGGGLLSGDLKYNMALVTSGLSAESACRSRYETAGEMVNTVKEARKRALGAHGLCKRRGVGMEQRAEAIYCHGATLA